MQWKIDEFGLCANLLTGHLPRRSSNPANEILLPISDRKDR